MNDQVDAIPEEPVGEYQPMWDALQAADPQYMDLPLDNPIRMIRDGRTEDFKEYLSAHPETMDEPDTSWTKRTFMHYAVMNNRDDIVEYLILRGSQARSIADGMGNFPIRRINQTEGTAILDVFIRHDTNLNEGSHLSEDGFSMLWVTFINLLVAPMADKSDLSEKISTLIYGGAVLKGINQNFPPVLEAYQSCLPSEEDRYRIQSRIFFEPSLLTRILRAI